MNNYSKIIKPDIQDLVKDNINLVKKIAWHLHGRVHSVIEIEDLIQIGMLGLISAAQNYTPQKDAAFSSYANIRIKGEILDYLRKNSNLCRSTIKMKKVSEKAASVLRQKFGREPNNSEIAKEIGMTTEKFYEWTRAFEANVIRSLDDSYDESAGKPRAPSLRAGHRAQPAKQPRAEAPLPHPWPGTSWRDPRPIRGQPSERVGRCRLSPE